MANVLFVRSDWDLATKYLSTYGQLLIDYAQQQGHQTIDLYNDAQPPARNVAFEAEMQKIPPPDIVMIMGHGNKMVVTGQDLEVLLQVGVNEDLMSQKIAYLMACSTGIELGPAMVESTCQQYYGFQSDFTFVYNPNYENHPLDDPWAKAFFDCMLATGYAVLKGLSPLEVYSATIGRYDYWWNYWLKQNDPMADDILTWLNWNRSSFIALTPQGLGDVPAKIGPISPLALPSNLTPFILPLGLATAAFFLLTRKSDNES